VPERLLAGALVVHNRAMEEVRYYYDRKKFLPDILAMVIGICCGVIPIIFPMGNDATTHLMGRLTWLGLVLLGFWSLWRDSYAFFLKKPAIILTSEGIADNSLRESPGFVPWEHLSSEAHRFGKFLVLELLTKSHDKQENPSVPLAKLDRNPEEIEAQVRKFLKSAHDAQPPG
jgi:hypothetical protein